MHAHDARMRSFWKKTSDKQLDLLDADVTAQPGRLPMAEGSGTTTALEPRVSTKGRPLMVPVSALDEDTANPRTEFPDATLDDLAADIRERGILQPIIVEPLGEGLAVRYRVRLGARRLRAAIRAGLIEVPVTIASKPLDAYAQVAENLKRDGLSPLDLALFIRSRVDAGESNATIAKKLRLDQTTVAHHLTLLTLPPVLDEALKSGRCTSPRTLHELCKLHEQSPSKVEALLTGSGDVTRAAIAATRVANSAVITEAQAVKPRSSVTLIDQASRLCDRLEEVFHQATKAERAVDPEALAHLRKRLLDLATR